MTTPDQTELEKILAQAFTDGASDTMWVGDRHIEIYATALAAISKLMLEQRLAEAKHLEKETGKQFERLCREVETRPELGNSSKSKKHNFLDGAESMMLVPSIRIAELESKLKKGI